MAEEGLAVSLFPSQLAHGAAACSRPEAWKGLSQGTHCPLRQWLEQVQAPPGCLQGIGYLPSLSTPAESLI